MPTFSGSIAGHPDFELNVPRTVPVTYSAEVPDKVSPEGIVFIVPGFGGDNDEALLTLTRRHIAATYNLVAVSVRPHCYYCRPGAHPAGCEVRVDIDPWSIAKAIGALVLQGDDLSGLSSAEQSATLPFLRSRTEHAFELKGTIVPPGEDYQNFGVLVALDHLKVLADLRDKGIGSEKTPVICLGTSHGGYISHLIHKFAPNTVSAVIECSAYPQFMPHYVGFGLGDEYRTVDGNLTLVSATRSAWQTDRVGAPDYFGTDARMIREAILPLHHEVLSEIAPERSLQCRMLHSTRDRLVPIELKREQRSVLAAYGHDVALEEMGEKDLDGRFVTTLEHGMGVSLVKLFDRFYPSLSIAPQMTDAALGSRLVYPCGIRNYVIQHGAGGPSAARGHWKDGL
ncbi:MAG: hypothetical protein CML99_00440 [Rhodobiaceae bacterium]|nr:hypothetical protein [Rhodobiaceae bacterium]